MNSTLKNKSTIQLPFSRCHPKLPVLQNATRIQLPSHLESLTSSNQQSFLSALLDVEIPFILISVKGDPVQAFRGMHVE